MFQTAVWLTPQKGNVKTESEISPIVYFEFSFYFCEKQDGLHKHHDVCLFVFCLQQVQFLSHNNNEGVIVVLIVLSFFLSVLFEAFSRFFF